VNSSSPWVSCRRVYSPSVRVPSLKPSGPAPQACRQGADSAPASWRAICPGRGHQLSRLDNRILWRASPEMSELPGKCPLCWTSCRRVSQPAHCRSQPTSSTSRSAISSRPSSSASSSPSRSSGAGQPAARNSCTQRVLRALFSKVDTLAVPMTPFLPARLDGDLADLQVLDLAVVGGALLQGLPEDRRLLVTPTTCLFATRSARLPVFSRSRLMSSSQIETPAADSSASAVLVSVPHLVLL
jgi:hypothetical protein